MVGAWSRFLYEPRPTLPGYAEGRAWGMVADTRDDVECLIDAYEDEARDGWPGGRDPRPFLRVDV